MEKLTIAKSQFAAHIYEGAELVGELHLDYMGQVFEVVLVADSSPDTQLWVLRLAASHVIQYARNRTVFMFAGRSVKNYNRLNLQGDDSYLYIDFAEIPELIMGLDREALVSGLEVLKIKTVVTIHKTVAGAVDAALLQVDAHIVACIPEQELIVGQNITLHVAAPNTFTFWMDAYKPSEGGGQLYVIPGYHPIMKGARSDIMINGATDAYIRSQAVRHILCPLEAREGDGEWISASWSRVNHPYRAMGNTLELRLNETRIRTQDGVAELIKVLSDALGFSDRYISVSGGFTPPMECSHNRLLTLGRESPRLGAPPRGHETRGTEAHCVWTYRTLVEEGKLEGSFIPSWFLPEGWLGIYEGAPVGPDLY